MNKRSSQNCSGRENSIIPFMMMTILCLDDRTVRKCAVLFSKKMPQSSGLMWLGRGYGKVTQVHCNTQYSLLLHITVSQKHDRHHQSNIL